MLEINIKKQLGKLFLSAQLTIPSKGITAIFGLSGSGKTSLINLISGLLKPDDGYIYLNDRILFDKKRNICLPVNQRNIGYIFQDARLFPHYTVTGNLRYGIKNKNKKKFNAIVVLLGIEKLLTRYPSTLSGGEKQRVAIGRTLLTEPEILLMDEPLSALDLPRKEELLQYLENLAQSINIPILYVSHSVEELLWLAEHVIFIEQGKIKAYDQLEKIWNNPLFLPWKKKNTLSTILALPVINQHFAHHIALNMAGQILWVDVINNVARGNNITNDNNLDSHANSNFDEIKKVIIHSSDVSIALTTPNKTSIRNILLCYIKKIAITDQEVTIELGLGEYAFWCALSRWGYENLKLITGQSVYAQIKTVSLINKNTNK